MSRAARHMGCWRCMSAYKVESWQVWDSSLHGTFHGSLRYTLIERFFLHWMSLQNNQVNLLHFLQVFSHKSSELLRQLRSISIFLVKEFVLLWKFFSAHEHYNFIGENQPADGKKRVFVGMKREKKTRKNEFPALSQVQQTRTNFTYINPSPLSPLYAVSRTRCHHRRLDCSSVVAGMCVRRVEIRSDGRRNLGRHTESEKDEKKATRKATEWRPKWES